MIFDLDKDFEIKINDIIVQKDVFSKMEDFLKFQNEEEVKEKVEKIDSSRYKNINKMESDRVEIIEEYDNDFRLNLDDSFFKENINSTYIKL